MPLVLLSSLFGAPAALASPVPTGSPRDLSAAGQNGDNAQVAVDPAGNAVVVWQRFDGANWRVQARRRTAAGNLSAVQTLSAAGRDAVDPRVDVDAKGNAVVVWTRFDGSHDRIQARRRAASGTLSAVQTLSAAGGDAFAPQVALASDGSAVIVWERWDGTDNRIQAVRRTASGGLSAVQAMSAAGRDAFEPQVAVDANGNAIVVWYRSDGTHDRIQVRRRTAGGSLSAVQTLSAAGQHASNPQVGVDPHGNAVVVWRRFDGANFRVQARRRAAGGSLSAVQTLSAPTQDASDPQLAVDSSGNAVLAWYRSDGVTFRIQAIRRTAAGSTSVVQNLSAPGVGALGPRVAMDRFGNALLAWQQYDGGNFRAQAVRRSTSGELSAVETLSTAGQDAYSPELGVDPEGNALVTWTRFDGATNRVQASYLLEVKTLSATGHPASGAQVAVDSHGNAVLVWYRDDGANFRIEARRRTASGSFSAVQSLSPAGQDAANPQVAVDANGNAVIAWTRYDGANNRVQVRRRTASGSLSAVQTISAAGQSASSVHLAVDSSGNALVVWERYDGAHYRIQARRRTAGGNLSSIQTLSAAGQNAFEPHVAMDSSGNAVVVWRRYDGANDRIQVRRRTPSGALSAVQTLSAAGRPAFGPQVAVDPAGNAVVSWERFDGADSRIQVRRRTASGNLSAVQTLSATGQGASQSQVAVDKVGNAIVAWMVYDGANYRVQVVRRTAGGGLSEVKTLSAAGQDGIGPQLAVDGGGNAVVTWQQFDGAHSRILARRRSSAGNLGQVQTLSAAGHDAVGHEVAIDGSGNAVATWQWHDGSYYLIQAARLRTG